MNTAFCSKPLCGGQDPLFKLGVLGSSRGGPRIQVSKWCKMTTCIYIFFFILFIYSICTISVNSLLPLFTIIIIIIVITNTYTPPEQYESSSVWWIQPR